MRLSLMKSAGIRHGDLIGKWHLAPIHEQYHNEERSAPGSSLTIGRARGSAVQRRGHRLPSRSSRVIQVSEGWLGAETRTRQSRSTSSIPGALMRAGLDKRLMFGSGLDITEWAAGVGSMVKSIEDAPFLSPSDRTDVFVGYARRFLNLGVDDAARQP